MNNQGTWYILKTEEEHCQIIESLDEPSTEDIKYWGPFPSREDAIATWKFRTRSTLSTR